jgi:hypothetical protein
MSFVTEWSLRFKPELDESSNDLQAYLAMPFATIPERNTSK